MSAVAYSSTDRSTDSINKGLLKVYQKSTRRPAQHRENLRDKQPKL